MLRARGPSHKRICDPVLAWLPGRISISAAAASAQRGQVRNQQCISDVVHLHSLFLSDARFCLTGPAKRLHRSNFKRSARCRSIARPVARSMRALAV